MQLTTFHSKIDKQNLVLDGKDVNQRETITKYCDWPKVLICVMIVLTKSVVCEHVFMVIYRKCAGVLTLLN